MPGTIHERAFFSTNDLCRGMAFRTADPDMWLASPGGEFLEQMNKATGAIVADHPAGAEAWKVLYDPVSHQFYTSSAGGGGSTVVSRFDTTGTLIDNPTTGDSPYGQAVANGLYFTGDSGDQFITVLNAASGAPHSFIDVTPEFGPTASVGHVINTGASLWFTAPNTHLLQVDIASATLVNDFDLGPQGVARIGGLCFDGVNLWVSDFTNFQIAKLDLAGNVLATFPAISFGNPGPIAFDGLYLWLLDFGGGLGVYRLTGAFQTFTGVVGNPQDLEIDPADGPGWSWVTSGGGSFQVEHFQFVPPAPPAGGGLFEGTFTGIFGAGHFGGGTK